HAPDAVAAVLAYHRVVILLDEGLNRMADVAEVRAGPYGVDAAPHGRETGFGEALGMRRCLTDEIHAAGVAMEAIADHRDVDIDDVAGLQPLVVRDAVTDHVIHRGADGLGKAAVVQVRRHRALNVDDVVVADPVELFRGYPWHHVLADHVEYL